ncbi:2Fe-2S iron-sulfur cluster-binding protein [Undibacterium sp. TS12]|uniref:2Fe-2S iron-sulfur cluster-binding protein n=1 Tax=Undibacterium sp. TS12 TaxID=2908202 RepID=UPI001F4CBAE4|nr:2Fe-2S iron-sulfur cluster-binding protein [Undibacterium sp. TS12]MCH8618336.1 2Fe-2S iron-sulfur cluster-binding protein [Undibacterium sp. TS12]
MSRAFADISFTPSVKAAQSLYGSREANRGFELVEEKRDHLLERDMEFIGDRDSFYQATISQNGWPYVQHRGGPAGFLKILDAKTIAYADFSGNAQYLSVGNLFASDKISLILMDYATRRRMKIWGHANIIHEEEDARLIARLEMPGYRARVERAVVITVEAVEWNCPQHITPRFTEKEVQDMLARLLAEKSQLGEQLKQKLASVKPASLGNGPLELVITAVRQLSPRIRAYELRDPAGKDLPAVSAGAHLRVPVLLADGQVATRHYSISSAGEQADSYEIAVLAEPEGRGGSMAVHDHYALGMHLHCDLPHNDFALHAHAAPAVLIAGGIGITAIRPMAKQLAAQRKPYTLHYAGRVLSAMAYSAELQTKLGTPLHLYAADRQQRLDIRQIMEEAGKDSLFYVCGPAGMITAVLNAAEALGIDPQRVRCEKFTVQKSSHDEEIRVELARSKKVIHVRADQTVLHAVRAHGVAVQAECETGNCGTCAVTLLGGQAEHRDTVLTEAEQKNRICICVSRAQAGELVLDL